MSKILLNKSNIDLDYPICRPSLDLDFTQEVLDERITFSRGSIGTRVNRNRLIETVAANQPRFDYDPVTGECKGLLIEESRQNLFTGSNDFTVWTKQTNRGGVVGITTNILTSPDGTTNASRYFVQTGGGTFYSIYRSFTAAANTYYTYSVFAKAGEFNTIGLTIFDGSNNTGITYNIGNGTIVGSYSAVNMTVGNLSIINYGNGWYRCIFPFSHSLGGSFTPKIDLGGTSSNYGVYLYGAQLETGAFPTSYIPTTASTVTRSAELADMTGTNFSSLYNQTEGSVYCRYDRIGIQAASTAVPTPWGLSDGTISNSMSLVGGFSNPNNRRFDVIYQNVATAAQLVFSNTETSNRFYKVCVGYATNNISGSYEGEVVQRDISCLIPTVNRLSIGRRDPVSVDYLNGHISRLTYYPRALKPLQLQLLTQ